MTSNQPSKTSVRKLYDRCLRLKAENKSLKSQLETFYLSDDAWNEECGKLKDDNKNLLAMNEYHLRQNIKARVDKEDQLIEQKEKMKFLEIDLDNYKTCYTEMVKQCASLTKMLEDAQNDAEQTEKDLLNEIKQLDKLNLALQENSNNLNAQKAQAGFSWENTPENVVQEYFAKQCSHALSEFEEEEKKVLVWTIQNGFDPIQDSKNMSAKLGSSEKLRVHCLAKRQFEREANTFESLLENTKKEQMKDVLALHNKFAYELKHLHKQIKTTTETYQEDISEFKSIVSKDLRDIEKQVQGMDFGTSKFFQTFLKETFCSCNSSQQTLLNRFRDHSKYTQEIRIPSIQSAVSSLFLQLGNFNLKTVGLTPAHKRFLKTFNALKN